jgi:hypothetical protein
MVHEESVLTAGPVAAIFGAAVVFEEARILRAA